MLLKSTCRLEPVKYHLQFFLHKISNNNNRSLKMFSSVELCFSSIQIILTVIVAYCCINNIELLMVARNYITDCHNIHKQRHSPPASYTNTFMMFSQC